MRHGKHDIVLKGSSYSTRDRLWCQRCQKWYRNLEDVQGSKCRPRKDRGIVPWREPHYWADKKARQKH